MMVGDKEILKLIGDALPVVAIAATGGLVNFLRVGKWSLIRLAANLTGAGFSGLLVYACLSESGVSAGHMCAVAGIVGSSGGAMLEWAQGMLMDIVQQRLGGGVRDINATRNSDGGRCEHCGETCEHRKEGGDE